MFPEPYWFESTLIFLNGETEVQKEGITCSRSQCPPGRKLKLAPGFQTLSHTLPKRLSHRRGLAFSLARGGGNPRACTIRYVGVNPV